MVETLKDYYPIPEYALSKFLKDIDAILHRYSNRDMEIAGLRSDIYPGHESVAFAQIVDQP